MKWRNYFLMMIAALLIGIALPAFSQEDKNSLTVQTYIGKCEYRTDNGAWKVIHAGDKISASAEIRIQGKDSSLDLKTADGKVISIAGGTTKKLADIIQEQSMPSGNVLHNQSATVGMVAGSCEMKLAEGDWIAIKQGETIPETAEVRVNTAQGTVELDYPDGSVVNVLGLSSVKLTDIVKDKAGKKSSFIELVTGKLFAKVKPSQNQDFRVATESAVAAVRGTQFGVSFLAGQGGKVLVKEGAVAVGDAAGKFNPVMVQQGQMTSIPPQLGSAPTTPVQAPQDAFKEFGQEPPETVKPSQPEQPAVTPAPGPAPVPAVELPGQKKNEECTSKGGFNWSVSTEDIDSAVWNKVLLSPTFTFGSFSFGLYIPIYFKSASDIFTPSTWYNYDEWNFGSFTDSLHDLLLKIKFIQYQNDLLMAKLGTIPDMTIGHGALINGYANDTLFPAVRKVGFQFNLDGGVAGFESMIGDIFTPNLIGGRVFYRPIYGTPLFGNLGIGLSGFVDTDPMTNQSNMVFGYSADADFPLLKNPIISSVLYADVATLGFKSDQLNTNSLMKGFGVMAGFKGNIAVITYSAEYRFIQGGFIPNYVDKFYDAQRAEKYAGLVTGGTPDYNGFLLGAGYTMEGVGGVGLSYEQLFQTTSTTNINNTLHIEANVSKCLFKKAYGIISYDRKNFSGADLFNQFLGNGTLVTTKIYYQVAEGAYIGLSYKKYYQADSTGAIVEKNTFGIETQMGL